MLKGKEAGMTKLLAVNASMGIMSNNMSKKKAQTMLLQLLSKEIYLMAEAAIFQLLLLQMKCPGIIIIQNQKTQFP